MKIRDGISGADEIHFPNLGYADAAIDSYMVFERLKAEGVIPEYMRFQVGLPTPLSVAIAYLVNESKLLFEQAYQGAIEGELQRILDDIPAEMLSVQWETVFEFALLEGTLEKHLKGDLLENINTRVAALVDLVPEPAESGIHFCYRDSGHKHFTEPKDTTYLVQIAIGVVERTKRNTSWIHMPVPRERDDVHYFSSLSELKLDNNTELYLGVVHQTGGLESTQRPIETALRCVKKFGIATECGFGRRGLETIPGLLEQHAHVADKFRLS